MDDGRDRKRIPSFSKAAAAPWARVFHAVDVMMNRMMRLVMEIQGRNFRVGIIRQAMREAIGPEMRLTKENLSVVSQAVGEAYVKHLVDFGLLKE